MKIMILIIIVISVLKLQLFSNELKIMTEEFPPYNFTKNDSLMGSSSEIMHSILKQLYNESLFESIQVLPWSRAYKLLEVDPNSILFSVTRTAKRENLFKWVGPISKSRNVLLALKDSKINIATPEDLFKYKIGAMTDDAAGQLLTDKFFVPHSSIDFNPKLQTNLLKLKHGRIDLFAYDENVTRWAITKNNMDPNDYETVFVLEEGFHYIAFNPSFPDSIINLFQSTLDTLKSNGQYNKIMIKYNIQIEN
ncbi:MAG: ABC transporter substrate-binding protein [Candidatus Delongbacteria bacterium]|nr:ABC transporter substrate-binding protein [Candidatus Delongbacteria bacterium]MBN2836755.1 ABC transporter substrate-binding protein [Candidatus Delongbacteria bacterium]